MATLRSVSHRQFTPFTYDDAKGDQPTSVFEIPESSLKKIRTHAFTIMERQKMIFSAALISGSMFPRTTVQRRLNLLVSDPKKILLAPRKRGSPFVSNASSIQFVLSLWDLSNEDLRALAAQRTFLFSWSLCLKIGV